MAVNLAPFVAKLEQTPGVFLQGILPVDTKTGEPDLDRKFGLKDNQTELFTYTHTINYFML